MRQLLNPLLYLFLIRQAATALGHLCRAFAVERMITHNSPGYLTFKRYVGRGVKIESLAGLELGAEVQIGDDSELHPQGGRIRLGPWVNLGTRTSLRTLPGDLIRIGAATTIHGSTHLVGKIRIGQNCLFARNIFFSSYDHHIGVEPPLLIRDQDRRFFAADGYAQDSGEVTIEDDCWLAWGVVVKRGVTIGRGCVVGANAVVTKNVPPYTMVAGVPARVIRSRLNFQPPELIDAACDAHVPYFYRGFAQSPRGTTHEPEGARLSEDEALLVLAGGARALVRLVGRSEGATILQLSWNGAPLLERAVEGDFTIDAPVPQDLAAPHVPAGLELHHVLGLFRSSSTGRIWIKQASVSAQA